MSQGININLVLSYSTTRRHMMIPFAIYCLYLLLAKIQGQVQNRGQFDSLARQLFFGKRTQTGDLSRMKFTTPFLDSEVLRAMDKPSKGSPPGPIKVAQAIPVEIDSRKHGVWEADVVNGVNTWSLLIQSKTALSLALVFANFTLPPAGELYVINDESTLGAYTSAINNKKSREFSIQSVKGDQLFIIYIEPMGASPGLEALLITQVVHGYRFLSTNAEKDSSGSCEVDARCLSSWNDQKRATIVFMTDQLQRFCSGVMINNGRGDGRQLLLTANHCVFTDLSNSIAGFNYERLGCGTGTIRPPQTAHGMKLLARWPESDFALFEVQERIPASYNVYLNGWDARKQPASNVAGIHHPSGDVKKIFLFTGTLQSGSWSEGPGRSFHWVIPAWSRGVTEPGSSGSPLFTSAGLVIGQLHGGASACNNPGGADLYGGLAFSFEGNGAADGSLKPYLDPLARGLLQLPGRDLYPAAPIQPTPTVTRTTTVTVCPSCIPRDMVERLLNSTNARLDKLERNIA